MKVLILSSKDQNFSRNSEKLIWQHDLELGPNTKIALASFFVIGQFVGLDGVAPVTCNLVERDAFNPNGILCIVRKSFQATNLCEYFNPS